MKIGGFHKSSFVDYPGQIAAVVFTQGCNMNCFYCHNKSLCTDTHSMQINQNEILDYLSKRKKMLDAVVITGGEPTLHKGLENFIGEVKKLGYKVKLDTNGTNPSMVKNLIDKKMIDYIAMDIKAPIDKYDEVCGTSIDKDKIEQSMDMLMSSKVEYEFRTTFIPQLDEQDIKSIANRIKGSKRYILQQYRPVKIGDSSLEVDTGRKVLGLKTSQPPHPDGYIHQSLNSINNYVKVCETRGLKVKVS